MFTIFVVKGFYGSTMRIKISVTKVTRMRTANAELVY